MEQFLWLGTLLGAAFGALHGLHIYRSRTAAEGTNPVTAAYYGLWAFALWCLFGSYLLLLWLIGAAGMALSGLKRSAAAKP